MDPKKSRIDSPEYMSPAAERTEDTFVAGDGASDPDKRDFRPVDRDEPSRKRPVDRAAWRGREAYEGSSRDIEEKIDVTRDHIDQVLSYLGHELDPRSMLTYAKSYMTSALRSRLPIAMTDTAEGTVSKEEFRESVRDYFNEHPFSSVFLGCGVVAFVAEEIGLTPTGVETMAFGRSRARASADWRRRKAEDLQSWRRDRVQRIRERVSARKEDLKDRVRHMRDDAKDRLASVKPHLSSSATGDRGVDLEQSRRFVQGNPMIAGLAMAGAGLLIGLALPTSTVERRYIAPQAQDARRRVVKKAREAVEENVRAEPPSRDDFSQDTVARDRAERKGA